LSGYPFLNIRKNFGRYCFGQLTVLKHRAGFAMLEKMVEAGEGFYGDVAVACGVQAFFPSSFHCGSVGRCRNESHRGNGPIDRGIISVPQREIFLLGMLTSLYSPLCSTKTAAGSESNKHRAAFLFIGTNILKRVIF
jgi:hypothetical protein